MALARPSMGLARLGWRSNLLSAHGLSLHIGKGLGAARAAQEEGDADFPLSPADSLRLLGWAFCPLCG